MLSATMRFDMNDDNPRFRELTTTIEENLGVRWQWEGHEGLHIFTPYKFVGGALAPSYGVYNPDWDNETYKTWTKVFAFIYMSDIVAAEALIRFVKNTSAQLSIKAGIMLVGETVYYSEFESGKEVL